MKQTRNKLRQRERDKNKQNDNLGNKNIVDEIKNVNSPWDTVKERTNKLEDSTNVFSQNAA